MAEPAAAKLLDLRFRLNGREEHVQVSASLPLIDLLRDQNLPGTKLGCSRGVCGSCTVLIDGQPAASCSLFAFHAEGCEITTIEAVATDRVLGALRAAFTRQSAFQCGYCTAGMMMLAKGLLDREASPSRVTVVEWMSSNICRCTGYAVIIEAVLDAAAALRRNEAGP
jgi:carbon-monoxide dehydrogenase small subunit